MLFTSVVDRHRCDGDPDPNFHSDADPDLDWLKNDANPQADPTPCFTQTVCLYKNLEEHLHQKSTLRTKT